MSTTVDVTTPHGDRYRINCDTGRLIYFRRDGGRVEGSPGWTITGIARTPGPEFAFGSRVPGGLAALAALAGRSDLRDARSRAPRFTLTDLDHGTKRTHGNTTHHGIATVTVVKEGT